VSTPPSAHPPDPASGRPGPISHAPAGKPLPPVPALDGRGLPQGYPYQPDWEVTPREVKDRLARRAAGTTDFLLLDCRKEEEWRTARIDGAVLVPLPEIPMRLEEIEGPDGSRDRPIVVHCHTGRRSLKATALLRAAGFSDVRSMAGGIELWSIDIDPAVPRYA
jgi:rhodanese-related sulfurtransferase